LVKWKGYAAIYNSWEPQENIPAHLKRKAAAAKPLKRKAAATVKFDTAIAAKKSKPSPKGTATRAPQRFANEFVEKIREELIEDLDQEHVKVFKEAGVLSWNYSGNVTWHKRLETPQISERNGVCLAVLVRTW
jgi:hypothetical protein